MLDGYKGRYNGHMIYMLITSILCYVFYKMGYQQRKIEEEDARQKILDRNKK